MKVLIGTPIHQDKDYAMEKWLENVSRLEYPADFLMVDNSVGLDYVKKIKGHCKKYRIKQYQIKHIDIPQFQSTDEKIGRSREVIRQEILSGDYDAWFSWESDQIIPANSLDKLVKIMTAGNYAMVHLNSWSRNQSPSPIADFGCCLIHRWCLEKYGFLLEYPDMRDCWHGGETWLKKQVLKGGGSYIEIYGIINPIYHLNQ